jgi:hypothetical protein
MPNALKSVALVCGALAILTVVRPDAKIEGMAWALGWLAVGLLATCFAARRPPDFIKGSRRLVRQLRQKTSRHRAAMVLALVLSLSGAFAAGFWTNTPSTHSAPAHSASAPPSPEPLRPKPALAGPAAQPPKAANERALAMHDEVLAAVEMWRQAWATQNTDRYLAAYSSEFTPAGGVTLVAWRAQRLSRIGKAQDIKLSLEQLEVQVLGNQSTVRFYQFYNAVHVQDTMRKLLRLERSGGHWHIIEESLDVASTAANRVQDAS